MYISVCPAFHITLLLLSLLAFTCAHCLVGIHDSSKTLSLCLYNVFGFSLSLLLLLCLSSSTSLARCLLSSMLSIPFSSDSAIVRGGIMCIFDFFVGRNAHCSCCTVHIPLRIHRHAHQRQVCRPCAECVFIFNAHRFHVCRHK